MSKVYALFVGINEYQSPLVGRLGGCVSDIQSVTQLFAERTNPADFDAVTLLDADATRANIIATFQSHLGRATADDTALFYFCGHGSTEPCPPEWERLEPSKRNQTLVPVDARLPGVYEIADKELSALIHDVAASGAQVVVITDSCHSSGNTRDVGDEHEQQLFARMAPDVTTSARTINDYLEAARALYAPDVVLDKGRPSPRHIAIAACQDFETAKEYPAQAPRRGVFTLSFEEAMRALGPSASYVDVVNAVRLKVAARLRPYRVMQMPDLHLSGGADGNQLFLGGHVGRADLKLNSVDGQWWLSAGAIDGIPPTGEGNDTEIAIFELGAFGSDSAASSGAPVPVATATVAQLEHDRARVTVNETGTTLDPSRVYIASITRLGSPALDVVVDAASDSAEAAQRVRTTLSSADPLFAVVHRVTRAATARVFVAGDLAELRDVDGKPLEGLRYTLDDAGRAKLTEATLHLARWHRLLDLSPKGARLNGQVQVELVPMADNERTVPPEDRPAHAVADSELALQYADGKAPRMVCRIRNTSSERLFVALLNLSDCYDSSLAFGDWIQAGGVAYAHGGAAFRLTIKAWRTSRQSTTDYFKVVASIEPFLPDRWTLPELIVDPAKMATRSLELDVPPAAPVVRTASGIDAFWGTSLLKVVTTR